MSGAIPPIHLRLHGVYRKIRFLRSGSTYLKNYTASFPRRQ